MIVRVTIATPTVTHFEIAKALLEFETLDGAQVKDIVQTGSMKNPPRPPSGGAAKPVTPMPPIPLDSPAGTEPKGWQWVYRLEDNGSGSTVVSLTYDWTAVTDPELLAKNLFPMVSEEHITCFGWANTQDMDDIVQLTLRINDFLTGLFLGVGIRLIDFKLEFGRLWENEEMRIILADEISPDNCRLWDAKTHEKLDKDRFRRDLGGVVEAYSEVAKRLGIMPESVQGENKGPVLVQ